MEDASWLRMIQLTPYEILKARGSGTVKLTGTLSAQGRIVGIDVKQTKVNTHEQEKMLENQAVQNLRSWQVEPASDQRPVPIEITYAYTIDTNLKHAWSEANFELPTKVVIRGNPELLK